MTKELPVYRSHKTVRALEIAGFCEGKIGDKQRSVWFKDTSYEPAVVPIEALTRYMPVDGDFYVIYADGYQSFSPRKAFLEGYTLETQIHSAGSQT